MQLKSGSYSWFASTWQGGHVGGQNNRIFSRRIYLKMELCFQRRGMLLFLTTSMASVTWRANQQYKPREYQERMLILSCINSRKARLVPIFPSPQSPGPSIRRGLSVTGHVLKRVPGPKSKYIKLILRSWLDMLIFGDHAFYHFITSVSE